MNENDIELIDAPYYAHPRKINGDWMVVKQTDSGFMYYRIGTGWLANYQNADRYHDDRDAMKEYDEFLQVIDRDVRNDLTQVDQI